MGGRGGSSGISSGGSVSALSAKMQQLAQYALPGRNYDEKKAKQYYRVKKAFDRARQAENEKLNKEAAKRRTSEKKTSRPSIKHL